MSTQVLRRKGSTLDHSTFVGGLAETTFDTTLNRPVVHDGVLLGGYPAAMLHLAQTFPLSQTLAAEENFFGNTTDPDNAIVFLNPVGVGTNTLDFRTNGTLDANFIRKYNTTPFQIESASSGSLDFVIDSRDVATGTSIRFFTNGIRGSGTQTLLAEFEDNGMVNFTGALSMGTNLINDVVNPVAAQDAATKNYVDGLIAAGAPPFTDSTALVKGSGDATKLMRFELDGFTAATTRVLTPPDANIIIAGTNFDNAWADGVTQRFNPSGVTAGINVGAEALDPSFLINGDIWYQSTANELRARINGVTVALGAGSAPPFTDSNALVAGSVDPTKLLRFEVDGFTAGATRVLTPPDADITLAGTNFANVFSATQTIGAANIVLNPDGSASFAAGGAPLTIAADGQLFWGNGVSSLTIDGSLFVDIANGFITAAVGTQTLTVVGAFSVSSVFDAISTGAIGFFGATAVGQQAVVALINNTAGTTSNLIEDNADGVIYANDSSIIRDNFSSLTDKVNEILTALNNYGLVLP